MNHLFILGAGRSGTKIVRDCLGAATDVSAIPYDVGFIWKHNNQHLNHDEILADAVTGELSRYMDTTLNSLAKKASPGKSFSTIIEKSVPNVLRPEFVAGLFPEAKVLHLVRNGYSVIESSLRNWEQPEDTGYFLDKLRYVPLASYQYALWSVKDRLVARCNKDAQRVWGPRYREMDDDLQNMPLLDVCSKQWSRCVDICDRQLESLDNDRVMHVRVEELAYDVELLEEICRFANISDVDSVVDFYRTNFDHDRIINMKCNLIAEDVDTIKKYAGNTIDRYAHSLNQ